MNVQDFDFELPGELIAQRPAQARDASRLMVLGRESSPVAHRRFHELAELLRPGDLLVLNDTRVIPARLVGRKASGGRVELLLVERGEGDRTRRHWRSLLKASRKPTPGDRIELGGKLSALILERHGAEWEIALESRGGSVDSCLEQIGRAPLPPYIKRTDDTPEGEDRERYQTVFSRHPGAIAAPTAGLHFTPELLDRLDEAGVERTEITLHVGLGTFQPVQVRRVEDHRMHAERFELPESAARAVAATRRRGGRVVAVGTTAVRTLEARSCGDGLVEPGAGVSDLFIYPGFGFRVVDALITNFHLPRSTLLMLVAAFAGRERVLAAYRAAIDAGYRFYSYGDAMLIEARR